jgi:hypothetical protein
MVRPAPDPEPGAGRPPGGPPPRSAVGTAGEPPAGPPSQRGYVPFGWRLVVRDLLSGNAQWAAGERAASGPLVAQILSRLLLLFAPGALLLAWLLRAPFAEWLRYAALSGVAGALLLLLGASLEALRRPPPRRPDGFIRKGRIGPRAV